MQTHYQWVLPHVLPSGETVFITYRLAGSIPVDVVMRFAEEKQLTLRRLAKTLDEKQEAYNEHKRNFTRFDEYLDQSITGPYWLKIPSVAKLIKDGIHHLDGEKYDLHAYCIMSNHVHLLVTIQQGQRPFHHTLKSSKGYCARQANELLSRTGQPFWHPESYDHVVRNHDEFNRIVAYILNNPVKAGLVDNWEAWPHSYCAEDL